ncbi:MAG: 4Fe-4S dicluster domain-containing protein [Candidatus Lokiarchaeota archaeon]|nr:4Fe-4S dicluster domain-containing protein [Candidatus Lokiarchaeota archaeon]
MSDIDIYEQLRQKLNIQGQGAPNHRAILDFLKIIWTEDDVKLLLNFDSVGKFVSAAKIAKNSGLEKNNVKDTLNKLAEKGTILKMGNQYTLIPFAPGIFEFYFVAQKDTKENFKKASILMEEIIEEVMPSLGLSSEFGIFRPKLPLNEEKIISIDESINAKSQVLAWEKVEEMLNYSDVYAKVPCQCRMVGDYVGDPCKIAPKDVGCFVTGIVAEQVIKMGHGTKLTKDEAIEYLQKAEKAGLVHSGTNISNDLSNLLICNCCPCHCGALKSQSKHKFGIVNKSNFEPRIDTELCVLCGTCVKKCPMNAIFHIYSTNERIEITTDYCIGCGICAVNCAKNAIKMVKVRDEIAPKSIGIGIESILGM